MKYSLIIIFLLFAQYIRAQKTLQVHENKVTHIISKQKISYLQVGSHELIMAEIVKEHPNLLRVKALKEFEGESTLSLVAEGKLYSLSLSYGVEGKNSYLLEEFTFQPADLLLSQSLRKSEMEMACMKLLGQKKTGAGARISKQGLQLHFKNIAFKEDLIFVLLELKNANQMEIELEGYRWWIKDKKQLKASNHQEYQIHPQYRYFELKSIPGKSSRKEIFVFPRFRIPEQKILQIQMLEKAMGNTGRRISLELKASDLKNPIQL
ncbi:DUF4138 domain-containing protein [Marinifilum sp. D714]|uniref:DUF4138 domain-containing protein n=1 Tax=Marinifilum sp. D714 TaxID=2937523 RepID=UPI0027C0E205|nr:DUF4138 domain-containing protein [Marinifilum sp. D714]MDQ2178566.1 conjugative transposon protein TraN [Marinifilum sp. D714]